MTISDPAWPTQKSPTGDILSAARYYLGSRFGLVVLAALALGLGAYSSWGWLVAAGIAPLLLTFAPCTAMCALGMCTMGGKTKNPADAIAPASVADDSAKLPLSVTALSNPNNKGGCCGS